MVAEREPGPLELSGSLGPLLGKGRAADVYDIGGGRVLRRYRDTGKYGTDPAAVVARETAVMRHLGTHGSPVPEVFDADGADLVMQRLDGVTMLSDLQSHPWRVRRHADTLVDLHHRLVAVPVDGLAAPEGGLPVRFGRPEAIVHLDFHPDNVMLTADGPVVFDWSNAALGPAAADVADAWIVAAAGTVEGPWWLRIAGERLRRRFVDRFVDGCGRAAAIALLPALGEHRLGDRNMRPEEVARIRQLLARYA
jgi:aminoglycoside phosphotransferase (APT) family kinase protein